MLPDCSKFPNRNVQTCGYVFHDITGLNHGMFVHQKQGLSLSLYVGDVKMAGKKQNMAPMWKKMMKHVDIDEPTTFLDHLYLGCTQRECKPSESINHRTMLQDVRIITSSAGAPEKLLGWEKASLANCSGLTTWRDMLKNALSNSLKWETRKWSNCTKFQVC